MTTAPLSPAPTLVAVPVFQLPAPVWPNVEYQGCVWYATFAGKNCGEWQLTIRRGDRQALTVPARLCRWGE